MFSPIANKDLIFVEDNNEMTMTFKKVGGHDMPSPFGELEYQFEDEDIDQIGAIELRLDPEQTQAS